MVDAADIPSYDALSRDSLLTVYIIFLQAITCIFLYTSKSKCISDCFLFSSS